jgi:hypothetical protein
MLHVSAVPPKRLPCCAPVADSRNHQPSGAIMSKAQDTKKAVKKEPAKSMKEKKAAKQAQKSEKKKFKPQ